MALVVQCASIDVPGPPPQLDIPHFGIMEKAWAGLRSIPDPDKLLIEFQDVLATALAPVRRFLEIVEVIVAIYNCVKAIPEAVMSLSPQPIYDCLQGLAKEMAKLLSWFPPMAYVRLGMELASYCIDLLDEIIALFTELDNTLTGYINLWNNAQALLDNELQSILQCASTDALARVAMALDVLKFIRPAADILNDVFIRLLPTSEAVKGLKKSRDDYQAADTYVASAVTAIRAGDTELPVFGVTAQELVQHPIVPVPPLGSLFEALNQTRNSMVMMYNILAPLVGEDANKISRDTPQFTNF